MLLNSISFLANHKRTEACSHVDSKHHSLLHTKAQDLKLLYKLNQLLIERSLLKPYQRILIAVSGGQDSICLLNMLHKLRSSWHWNIGIVHCDHKWYLNSKLQAIHVSRLAAHMKIHLYQAPTIQLVNNEQLARNWRYELIRHIAISHHFTVIVTGHTASDRLETLIYNLIRGSGVNGLQSMSWKRKLNSMLTMRMESLKHLTLVDSQHVKFRQHLKSIVINVKSVDINLIRPLLNITRVEIQQVVELWNLETWSDPSNRNLSICRNRIRHQLLPYLRRYFHPKIDYVLTTSTELIHTETVYLDAIAHSLLSKVVSFDFTRVNSHTYLQLDCNLLRAIPLAIQRRILKFFLDFNTKTSVSFKHVEQIRLACSKNANWTDKRNTNYINGKQQSILNRSICLPGQKSMKIINQRFLVLCE
uniref:tRNA(Ile)-lysidine synthase n=1 Tax=Zygnema circumcarinatum TaxID=35869 RepID=A0A6N0GXC4_ZYGCR|nr:hypothetical chloroplast RF62 [Zygnema circumcarinatum]